MKWRILLLSLGITIVCILIFTFAATQVYYNSAIDDSKSYLRVYMNAFNESYALDADGVAEFSEKLNGARVTFMTGRGEVLADSSAENLTANHSDRREVQDAILNGEGYAVRGSSTLGKNMVYFCKSFSDGDVLVRIAVATDSDWTLFIKTLPTTAQFLAIDIALCVVLAFVSTHFILNPVKKLATDAAAGGKVTGKYSELTPIANILNERNRNIQRQMSAK